MLGFFPLLALVVIAYNVIVFSGGPLFGTDSSTEIFSQTLVSVSLMSGDIWNLTLGGFFIIVSLIFLFIEIVKSTRTDTTSTINHALSLGVFIICLIEFLVMRGFGNHIFFMITAMTLMDVVAGYTVTIASARRDFGVASGGASIL